jgi:hypothetical protein
LHSTIAWTETSGSSEPTKLSTTPSTPHSHEVPTLLHVTWQPFDRTELVPNVLYLAPGADGIKPLDYAAEHALDFWSGL